MTNLYLKKTTINAQEVIMYLREQSVGDAGAFEQVLVNFDYYFNRWHHGNLLSNYYSTLVKEGKTPLIFDFGANIGASCRFFNCMYPNAKIVAIEPDQSNFELLKLNTKLNNVDCFNVAIGSENGFAFLGDPGLSDWGYRLVSEGGVKTEVKSASDLCRAFIEDNYVPFICKIDIEGAESDLFSKNIDWFEQFPAHVIELHDWLLPFQRTSQHFLRLVSALPYDLMHHGENIFVFHERLQDYSNSN